MDRQTLKEQIELLIDLQEKEVEANRIQSELDRIPVRIEEMQATLEQVESRLKEQKAGLEALKKIYRSQEADIQSNQARIQKRESQLRAVKTNQEYRAILKEIDDIKSADSQIEDKMLQCLDDMETSEKSIAELNVEYQQELARITAGREELEAYSESQRRAHDQLMAEREEILKHINSDILKKYKFAKTQTGSLKAIVVARDAICMGCNMNIPPQLYNELHRGDELKFCPHCYRMLYVL